MNWAQEPEPTAPAAWSGIRVTSLREGFDPWPEVADRWRKVYTKFTGRQSPCNNQEIRLILADWYLEPGADEEAMMAASQLMRVGQPGPRPDTKVLSWV